MLRKQVITAFCSFQQTAYSFRVGVYTLTDPNPSVFPAPVPPASKLLRLLTRERRQMFNIMGKVVGTTATRTPVLVDSGGSL